MMQNFIIVAISLTLVRCAGPDTNPPPHDSAFRGGTLTGPSAASYTGEATFSFTGFDIAATFECSLDDGEFAPCTSPTNLTGLADGTHTFIVRDIFPGYEDLAPKSFVWTIDTTPPDTLVAPAPEAPALAASAMFTVRSDDPAAVFECSLDGVAFQTCGERVAYTGLSDGWHTIAARAIDLNGRIDADPATYDWFVDESDPDTTIVSVPPLLATSSSASFVFVSNDPAATFECQLNGGDFAPCSNNMTLTGLADGPYALTVRAVDASGNVDQLPASYGWNVDTVAPDTYFSLSPMLFTYYHSAIFFPGGH